MPDKQIRSNIPERPQVRPRTRAQMQGQRVPAQARPQAQVRPQQAQTRAQARPQQAQAQLQRPAFKQPAKPKKSRLALRIISWIFTIGLIGSMIFLGISAAMSNVLPAKYFYPAVAVMGVIGLICLILNFRKKTKTPTLVVLDVIAAILIAVAIFAGIKVDETISFLNKNFTSGKEISTFNVLASANSQFSDVSSIYGQTVFAYPDLMIDNSTLEAAAMEQAHIYLSFGDNFNALTASVLEDNMRLILISSGAYESFADTAPEYLEKTKVVATIDVETTKVDRSSGKDLTKDSFTLYVSGIDTRSGTMPARSLSDVNIVITVNPNTKQILMTSIPRDYYVQLHGTTGLPDKLTHAGANGGIDLSIATINDLLDISIDDYVRVNFNFVTGLVDAIGGITLYSDVDYSFHCWTNQNCVFNPGNNAVQGDCALAFARERYAYSSGDRHRGENQEQVINKIIEKLTSSTTLITKYSSILNALSGTFETSLETSDITDLAKMQINDMASWKIEEYNLDGTTGYAYTYSYPNQQLSVMHPDQETVNTAKEKINAVYFATTSK